MPRLKVATLTILVACGIVFATGCGNRVTFVFPADKGVVKLPPGTKSKPFFRRDGEWVRSTNTVDLSGWTASYITPEEEEELLAE